MPETIAERCEQVLYRGQILKHYHPFSSRNKIDSVQDAVEKDPTAILYASSRIRNSANMVQLVTSRLDESKQAKVFQHLCESVVKEIAKTSRYESNLRAAQTALKVMRFREDLIKGTETHFSPITVRRGINNLKFHFDHHVSKMRNNSRLLEEMNGPIGEMMRKTAKCVPVFIATWGAYVAFGGFTAVSTFAVSYVYICSLAAKFPSFMEYLPIYLEALCLTLEDFRWWFFIERDVTVTATSEHDEIGETEVELINQIEGLRRITFNNFSVSAKSEEDILKAPGYFVEITYHNCLKPAEIELGPFIKQR